MNDFCLRCVFITLMGFQPPKSENRVLIWRLIMQIDEQDLESDHFYQLGERQDVMLDNTLHCDEVWIKEPKPGQADTRYRMVSNSVDEHGKPVLVTPVGPSLYQLTRAWHINNFPEHQVDYHQPCTYMLAGLLDKTRQHKLTFYMMQQVWEEMGLKEQYEDGSESAQMFRKALKKAIKDICPWLQEEIAKDNLPIECYIENFYARTVHNFGFNGDPMGLPIEVSYRLFELFIFFQDKNFAHFIALVMHCLQIKMVHILSLGREQLFRYVSNGCFLKDCFLVESDYEQLLHEAILPDFNHLDEFMTTFAGTRN